jgi:hypothetical protein
VTVVGTLGFAQLSDTEDWWVVLGTGIFGRLFGITAHTATGVPSPVAVTAEWRSEQRGNGMILSPATLVARKLFGAAPTEAQLGMCSSGRVFSGGTTILVVGEGFIGVGDGTSSLNHAGLVIPASAPWARVLTNLRDQMHRDTLWAEKMKTRTLALLAVLAAGAILKMGSIWRNQKKAKTVDTSSLQAPLIT